MGIVAGIVSLCLWLRQGFPCDGGQLWVKRSLHLEEREPLGSSGDVRLAAPPRGKETVERGGVSMAKRPPLERQRDASIPLQQRWLLRGSHCRLGCCTARSVILCRWWFIRSVVSDSLPPHGPWPARLLCPWDSPGKSTGVGCHALLQGIFPTQGLNLHLLLWQTDCLPLSHQGSLIIRLSEFSPDVSPRAVSFVFFLINLYWSDFHGGSDGKESACNAGDPSLTPGSRRTLEMGMQPTPVFLPGEFRGQKSLADYGLQGRQEPDTTEWLTPADFASLYWSRVALQCCVNFCYTAKWIGIHISSLFWISFPSRSLHQRRAIDM